MKLTYHDFMFHLGSVSGYLHNEKVMKDIESHGLLDMEKLAKLTWHLDEVIKDMYEVLNDPRAKQNTN